MAGKEYSDAELIKIARGVLESREKQQVAGRERSRKKSALYKLWSDNDKTPIGDIKL